MPPTEQILRPRGAWYLLFIALLIIVLAVGIGITVSFPKRAVLWGSITAIVAFLFVLPLAMLRRTHLRLTPEYFELNEGFLTYRIFWRDVSPFSATKLLRGSNYEQRVIVYDFVPGFPDYPKTRAWAKRLVGREGAISSMYGMSAEDLAELLNTWRARALSAPQSSNDVLRAD